MKNLLKYSLAMGSLLLLCTNLSSCNKYDELPPIRKEDVGNRLYKQPDPKALTPEQQAAEKAIRDEYNKNTK